MADKSPPETLENRGAGEDGRVFSPSAARNKDVILNTFNQYMPDNGVILEVACGTGEHAVHIADALAGLQWRTSEFDEGLHDSIRAWINYSGHSDRIAEPIRLDASLDDWLGIDPGLDGIISCNMVHIAPWAAGRGLLRGAGKYLKLGGRLFLYGPYARNGEHTSPSNADFDALLKSRNSDWGVRDLDQDIIPEAKLAGLSLVAVRDMPANNFSVIFEKT